VDGRRKPDGSGKAEAGRSIEGASWRLVGGRAGRSASGDGRGRIGRRSRKVGRRRESRIDWKAGPEDGSKAQAGDRLEGWPKSLAADESRRLSWKAEPEIGRRRKSEVGSEGEAEQPSDGANRKVG